MGPVSGTFRASHPSHAYAAQSTQAAEAFLMPPQLLARISTQLVRGKGSADFVAQGAVVPPGDGGVGGEAGLAEDGCVGAPVEADGDRVGGGGDRAGGFQEAALQHVGGDGGVAGQPRAERGDECVGEYAEHDVEVDVEVDGGGQGVGVEGLDDLGEALFDGHASGVVLDQGLGGEVVVVGDDDGGRVAAESGDDELAHGFGIVRQSGVGFVHPGSVVSAGPVQGDGGEVGAGEGVDLVDQCG